MRFATLLTASILIAPLAAQHGFSEAQRAELREIIRSEIRAAIQEMHSSHPAAKAGQTFGFDDLTRRIAVQEAAPNPHQVRTLMGSPHKLQENVEIEIEGKPHALMMKDVTFGTAHGKAQGKGGDQIVLQLNGKADECPALEFHGKDAEPAKTGKKAKKAKAKKAKKAKNKKTAEKGETESVEHRVFTIDGDHVIQLGAPDTKAKGKAFTFQVGTDAAGLGELFQIHSGKAQPSKAAAKKVKTGGGNVMFFSGDKGEAIEILELAQPKGGAIQRFLQMEPKMGKNGVMTIKIVSENGEETATIECPQIVLESCHGGAKAKGCCEEGEECEECEEGEKCEKCEEGKECEKCEECEECEKHEERKEAEEARPAVRSTRSIKKISKAEVEEDAALRTIDRILEQIR